MLTDLGETPADEQEENIADLKLAPNWFEDAVLWSVDWTTDSLISQLSRGNIDLDPTFQRRSAWTDERKSLFVESLVLGLPIPQIILAEDKKSKGRFIVIDGKQRLLAIRQFAAQDGDGFERLHLKGLKDRTDLNGKTYRDFKAEVSLRKDLDRFENQAIRTVVIRGWQHENYLYSVFLRINQGSVTLSPQELRQALHPGAFSTYIDEASANSTQLRYALNIDKPDFRMRDAELLLRFLAYSFSASKYKGMLKDFLDKTHIDLSKNWTTEKIEVEERVKQLELGLEFLRNSFGDREYLRKWNGTAFESRLNRAVFDVMCYYFSQPKIRLAAENLMPQIKQGFKALCEDRDFRGSVETTTKSRESNEIRFRGVAGLLSNCTGLQIKSPL